MTRNPDGALVVGVSLEGRSDAAVRWAAAEAQEQGLALHLVHGLCAPLGTYPGRSAAGVDAGPGLFGRARAELHATAEATRAMAPGLAVDETVVESDPVAVLRAQARGASMIVVGSHGSGALGEVALRGVAHGLVGHVDVPVAVVPPATTGARAPRDVVVVGDDGTEGCRGALRFATRRAAVRGVPLVVVRAGPDARLLSEELPDVGTDRPPALQVVLAEERADRVIAEQADDAELVVLGGEHGWRHPRHSTRRGLAVRARCPVVIVSPDWTPDLVTPGVLDGARR
ncbi:universal stress protein [Actinomycetospora lutea]|uniref:universal stress protein n=1 Tax=Actinomycetospora lutea TaxID=663604 RepID=UPI002365A788|nr:universal stress protein [Actinomycetospora lutea]MDD7939516.1 universal stress protein [Actinomycetospora lutea]